MTYSQKYRCHLVGSQSPRQRATERRYTRQMPKDNSGRTIAPTAVSKGSCHCNVPQTAQTTTVPTQPRSSNGAPPQHGRMSSTAPRCRSKDQTKGRPDTRRRARSCRRATRTTVAHRFAIRRRSPTTGTAEQQASSPTNGVSREAGIPQNRRSATSCSEMFGPDPSRCPVRRSRACKVKAQRRCGRTRLTEDSWKPNDDENRRSDCQPVPPPRPGPESPPRNKHAIQDHPISRLSGRL